MSADFVLKLQLHDQEKGTAQLRRIRLSSIFESYGNETPCFDKLVQHIESIAGYEVDKTALNLTYLDVDGDEVVVSFSEELSDAVEQFKEKGVLKFDIEVKPAGSGIRSQRSATLIPESVAASPSVPPRAPPSASRGISRNASASSHKSIPSRSTSASSLPEGLRPIDYPLIRFDPSRSAIEGLEFSADNSRVSQISRTNGCKCAYATPSFREGCQYFSFKILNKAVYKFIMVGVSDGSADGSRQCLFPGHRSDRGCALSLHNGNVYYSNTHRAMSCAPAVVKEAAKIGVLLDMNEKCCTFYADNQLVGRAPCELMAEEYFPVIVLEEQGLSVKVDDVTTDEI